MKRANSGPIIGAFEKKLRTLGTLTEEQRKVREAVQRLRERSHEWNRKYHEKVGMYQGLNGLDQAKRRHADELDQNGSSDRERNEILGIRTKFQFKLARRTMDIGAGSVDPEEPKAKANADEMRSWLEMVPPLLQHMEKLAHQEARLARSIVRLQRDFDGDAPGMTGHWTTGDSSSDDGQDSPVSDDE